MIRPEAIVDWKGSSPLARGLPKAASLKCVGRRIIPARAGFTGCRRCRSTPSWDHPRSRGVYASKELWAKVAAGSSPLARGLPRLVYFHIAAAGIIPARAGFTTPESQPVTAKEDHPRSRGVYTDWTAEAH